MTEHTPGPWVVQPDLDVTVIDGPSVCRDADSLATARLIAAAPDMLAALREVWAYLDDPTDPVHRASIAVTVHDAIAKAEGTS